MQPHEAERVVDAPADFRRVDAGAAQAEGDVVPTVSQGKRRVFLEHRRRCRRARRRDRPAFEVTVPSVGALQAGEHVEQGRLAAAGRSDDGEEFAARQIEIDRAERMQRCARTQREDPGDVLQPDVNRPAGSSWIGSQQCPEPCSCPSLVLHR